MKTTLRTLLRLSRPLLIADVVLVGLAVFFAISLSRELSHAREVPPPKARPQQAAAAAATPEPASASEKLETYNLIVAKHLFAPSRSETAATQIAAASATPPLVKPLLHGVVVDGEASLAYLEDPGSKRVMAYRLGDSIGGGTLATIDENGVRISRADTQVDVLLRDPAKPQPQAPADAKPAPAVRPQTRQSNPADQSAAATPTAAPTPRSGAVRTPRNLPTPAEAANPPQSNPVEE